MKLPIVERIRRNMIETLKGVTVTAGYSCDLNVEYFRENANLTNSETDATVVVIQGDASADADPPLGHDGWQQRFNVDCYIMESEESATSLDDRCNAMIADIIKSLSVDHTRGGLSVDTRFDPPRFNDSHDGFVIDVVVHYRTLMNDPFNQ